MNWIDLDWMGQKIYLPSYVKRYREFESRILNIIETLDFQEIFFPKLLTLRQYNNLRNAAIGLSREWSTELITANPGKLQTVKPPKFTLSHWQCEPFYFYLKKIKPDYPILLFDRSGWTYRLENNIDDYRLIEFQRIECVWFLSNRAAKQIQQQLMAQLLLLLKEYNLKCRFNRQVEEEQLNNEKCVQDIEVLIKDRWIEVVGTHQHGQLFLKHLKIINPLNYVTGCCGIGMTRIINILSLLDSDKNPSRSKLRGI